MRRAGGGRSWPGSSSARSQVVEVVSVLPLLRQNGGMQHRLRLAATAAAVLVLLVPAQAAVAGAPTAGSPGRTLSAADAPDRPRLLERAGHGRAVVEALGADLPQAAATNQMSATKLRAILDRDPSAWLGADGQLFYVEEAATAAEAAEIVAAESVPMTTYADSETWVLHSSPGSSRKIYLDFDGTTVSGTWWNSFKGMPSRWYTGFTMDSDPTTFTAAEKAFVQQVWRMVAEKFAAFDVDVTTEDPGAAGYDRDGSSDQYYGDHVVITDDAGAVSAACGGLCSGVALVGTFDDYSRTDSYYEPAWVFTSKTYDSSVLTAHTVAHEVGHTLGLNHDGNSVTSYSSGHANWFPLMGSSTKGVGQWSKGEYFDANNTEDDLAVMTANGAPVRVDDHGSDRANARQLGAAESYVVDGVISTRADQDVFAIDRQCTEPITAAVGGVGPGASLDLKLEVLGPDGTVLAADDPTSWHDTSQWPAVPTGMNASLTAPAGLGTYYLRVDGVGKGNPATDGYSDYGSLGVYRLVVAGCGGTLPPLTTPSTITTTTTTTTGGTTSTSTAAQAPSAPLIGRAAPGRRGGKVTALARWAAPVSSGGATIVGYRVQALKLSSSGRVLRVVTSSLLSPSSRAMQMRLAKGRYRFRVIAYNQVGASPLSTVSRIVTAR